MKKKSTGLRKVYEVFVDACEKVGKSYLTLSEARNVFQMAPGFSFPKDTTVEDIYQEMERSGLVSVGKLVGVEGKVLILWAQEDRT